MYSGGGGGGGVGGGSKRGKGGGGGASRNNHQPHQEMMHAVQQLPVMAQTQPITHIQPFIQTFHQPGMHTMFPIQFTYVPTNAIHPGFPNAVPQTQYVFPRASYTGSVPVNLQTFSAIPPNLAQNHTSHTNPLTPLRSSHAPIVVATAPPSTLHAAHSSTSTTYKKRTYALEIIDPETRKNIMEPWKSTDDVKKDKAVEEKTKTPEPAEEPVDLHVKTEVPAQVSVKAEEKEETAPEDGKYFLKHFKKTIFWDFFLL